MAKARVRSVLFTLLACGFGLSAISMVRADVTISPNIYGFALHALTVSPSQDGGVLFTGNDVPVTDKNGNPVGSMDVAGFFGSPALPTGSFLSATMSLNDQQQRIDLAKMWFSTTLEVGIAASLTENQATLLNADLHIIGDTGVFVTYGEPSRPLSPPLSLSNAFRTNAPPTDRNLGNAVIRYRNPPNEWNLVTGFGVAVRMGQDISVSFATAYMSGSIDLKQPDAGDGQTGIMVSCLTTPNQPLRCPFAGLGQWKGFGGEASSATAASFGLNPGEYPFASRMNVTHQPEPSCSPGQRPQEAPQVNAVVGRTRVDSYVVVAGWSPVPCATRYRGEWVDYLGNTVAAITTDRPSLAWELIELSDIPARLRITPQNTEGDGAAAFEASWSAIYGTYLRF